MVEEFSKVVGSEAAIATSADEEGIKIELREVSAGENQK